MTRPSDIAYYGSEAKIPKARLENVQFDISQFIYDEIGAPFESDDVCIQFVHIRDLTKKKKDGVEKSTS